MAFAKAFDIDPCTASVLVVLMTLDNGVHHVDWNAAYMLPRAIVEPNLLRGIWQLVWKDDNTGTGYVTRMPTTHQEKQLQNVTLALHKWLKDAGCGQGVRAKKARLKHAQTEGISRLTALYEGQLVLVDGIVAEVRGLEKAHGEFVFVLPYSLVKHETPSSSLWHLTHQSKLRTVPRSSVLPADWTWHATAGCATVHIG